ncbi:ISPsy23, transposition helper protein, truncated [Marinobacter sp. ELB17]|nr:ISPsy23, transposition helper protein, truncated [Marinobacter sp. ELB17]
MSREILSEKLRLARVSGKNQVALQSTFREYDQKLKKLQRQRIASALAERHVPGGNAGGRKSEYTEMALIENIDKIGYLPFGREEANMFFNVIAKRYEHYTTRTSSKSGEKAIDLRIRKWLVPHRSQPATKNY